MLSLLHPAEPSKNQPPGGVACGIDFGRRGRGRDEHPAIRAAPLDGWKRDPDGVPVGQRQIIDGNITRADLLERHPAIRTVRLATAVTKHRDLHTDFFHQNLTQDASGEPEQFLVVE